MTLESLFLGGGGVIFDSACWFYFGVFMDTVWALQAQRRNFAKIVIILH